MSFLFANFVNKKRIMIIKDIEKLVASDESRTLELKKTTGELKDAMHTACAFLNSDGVLLQYYDIAQMRH